MHTRESNAGLRQPKGLKPARWQLLLGKMKKSVGGEVPSNVALGKPLPLAGPQFLPCEVKTGLGDHVPAILPS